LAAILLAMIKYSLSLLLVLLPTFSTAAECTKQDAIKAETTAAYIQSWGKLEEHYSKYWHCDDGAIAEGYSESISFLMGNQWPEFLSYKMGNSFLYFVQRHIDETWDAHRLNKVAKLASSNCNKSKESICMPILNSNYNGLQ